MAISTTPGYDDLPALLTLLTGDEKHDRSSHSTLDVLWVLYDRVLRIDPSRPDDPERDRFLLSKGHGPTAYYAVLAAKGFIPVESLAGFGAFDSALGYHPDRVLAPGVEISSGSLGHGLPIAVGSALALDARFDLGDIAIPRRHRRGRRRGLNRRGRAHRYDERGEFRGVGSMGVSARAPNFRSMDGCIDE